MGLECVAETSLKSKPMCNNRRVADAYILLSCPSSSKKVVGMCFFLSGPSISKAKTHSVCLDYILFFHSTFFFDSPWTRPNGWQRKALSQSYFFYCCWVNSHKRWFRTPTKTWASHCAWWWEERTKSAAIIHNNEYFIRFLAHILYILFHLHFGFNSIQSFRIGLNKRKKSSFFRLYCTIFEENKEKMK